MTTGGELIAEVLVRQGVRSLFTLCGGHISPILVSAKRCGIRVVDVRHEADAVFAADAVARLSGIPGVAAVTAGPGVTNTITAVKNCQLAQSPVVVLGGATATVLRGRGSLQDIDQMALFAPHVKWATTVGRVRQLPGVLARAFAVAQSGVPGPVFVECPLDLLYAEPTVRQWYGLKGGEAPGIGARALAWYLSRHLDRQFAGVDRVVVGAPRAVTPPAPGRRGVTRAAALLARCERPVLLVGSQATLEVGAVSELAQAIDELGLPVYLAGTSRGLLGVGHRLQLRHQRKQALRRADLVILAGVPFDFRLDYGRHISPRARVVAANRSRRELRRNRRPTVAVEGAPGLFLRELAAAPRPDPGRWASWLAELRAADRQREAEIDQQASVPTDHLNPLALLRAIDGALADDSVLVVDGGDFVASASYVVSPRGPLRWLDPGVFGTLGVGAGFALGARVCHPEAEVWILYGDGSAAYSLAELDTFRRHGLPVIAVVGNDAGWTQIAREQVELLGDDVGTVLRRTDYHRVAEGYGGKGLLLDDPSRTAAVLAEAKALAGAGHAVLINALLGKTDFRKGSISV